MNVYVCAGSSCHIKGSYKIIELMRKAIEEFDLADKVQLRAAFCMGNCGDGVNVRFDQEIVGRVTPENFDEIFRTYVLERLN